jgi:ribosomal protein S18 acetylase RimI-like enzyme
MRVRGATENDDLVGWLGERWGEPVMIVHGTEYDLRHLPAFVAEDSGRIVGVLTLVEDDDAMEIVSCDADLPGNGVGGALVAAAVKYARSRGLGRAWCTTTNDNLPALGFWQSVGFELAELRPNAVAEARSRKPSIPRFGHRGLPIRDELDLVRRLRVAPGDGPSGNADR